MDPITQSKLLVSNINAIKNNIFEIARQLGVPVDQLSDFSPCNLSKIFSNRVCSIDITQHINDLQQNLAMLQQQQQTISQSGGYNYIVNPVTNRKVNINSSLGKKLIKKYSENL